MYTKMEVDFLRDDTDTVHHYESQGQKRKGQFEQGMEALSQMDRIKQVNYCTRAHMIILLGWSLVGVNQLWNS